MYKSRLGSVDDLVVAVVGDIDASEIERLARHYIGTLPAGEADTYVNRQRPMPTGLVQRQVRVGEGESAVLQIYHEADLEVTPLRAVAADVLGTAMAERLFLVIREDWGLLRRGWGLVHGNAAPPVLRLGGVRHARSSSLRTRSTARCWTSLRCGSQRLTPAEFDRRWPCRTTDTPVAQLNLSAGLPSAIRNEERVTQQRAPGLAVTSQDVQALAAAI